MPIEVTPVLIPSEDESGSIWRSEKLRDFKWRIECLGLQNNANALSLLQKIAEETHFIEELAEKQKQEGYERRWWQDGEYDSERADNENDKGLAFINGKKYSEAFSAFTEAIRLCPTSAVYHCNRAAAALKLNQPKIAAQDAENALERYSDYLKAHLRAAKAHVLLKQPKQAQHHFEKAMLLDPQNSAAIKGMKAVDDFFATLRQEEAKNKLYADAGERPPLSRSEVREEDAALQLYTSEQILDKNPCLESAKCSKIEALIECKRYQDALLYSKELIHGVERLYLEAEAQWRSGDVDAALTCIEEALQRSPSCEKCIDLQSYLNNIQAQLYGINAALEDEIFYDVIEFADTLIKTIDAGACCGLYCLLLCQKSRAEIARNMLEEAHHDLEIALSLDACNIEALVLRAAVHKKRCMYIEYFLDVQKLQKIAPGHEDLPYLSRDAAHCCCSSPQHGTSSSSYKVVQTRDGSSKSALKILGIDKAHASYAEIRRAYLQCASDWHPDKWNTATEEKRKNAEDTFKEIQSAYELLSS